MFCNIIGYHFLFPEVYVAMKVVIKLGLVPTGYPIIHLYHLFSVIIISSFLLFGHDSVVVT